jgi:hypothetical protein
MLSAILRCWVTGDRELIFDAIANLVDNAIKHGRPGGQVVVANEIIEGRPVVSIADDGLGIPAEEYEHVFKRFYRREHSRYTPGNGLGLSLVAAVARSSWRARIEMLDTHPASRSILFFGINQLVADSSAAPGLGRPLGPTEFGTKMQFAKAAAAAPAAQSRIPQQRQGQQRGEACAETWCRSAGLAAARRLTRSWNRFPRTQND